jgi:hypothetical protein
MKNESKTIPISAGFWIYRKVDAVTPRLTSKMKIRRVLAARRTLPVRGKGSAHLQCRVSLTKLLSSLINADAGR